MTKLNSLLKLFLRRKEIILARISSLKSEIKSFDKARLSIQSDLEDKLKEFMSKTNYETYLENASDISFQSFLIQRNIEVAIYNNALESSDREQQSISGKILELENEKNKLMLLFRDLERKAVKFERLAEEQKKKKMLHSKQLQIFIDDENRLNQMSFGEK